MSNGNIALCKIYYTTYSPARVLTLFAGNTLLLIGEIPLRFSEIVNAYFP